MKQIDKFKDLEYVQVFKNGKQVLFIPGSELLDVTKYDIQVKIGKALGDDRFTVYWKQKGINKTSYQQMRSIVLDPSKNIKQDPSPAAFPDFFKDQFNKMETLIEKISNKSDSLKEENLLLKLQLAEAKNKDTGIDLKEILSYLPMLFKNKMQQPILSDQQLQDPGSGSDPIPAEIKQLLNKIDWNNVPREYIPMILEQFEKYKKFIPLKEG